ncbi:MAG: hypothetical protein ACI4JW_01280 [Oscillospiraceae bacterium]
MTSDSEASAEETKELEKLDFSPLLGWGNVKTDEKKSDEPLKLHESEESLPSEEFSDKDNEDEVVDIGKKSRINVTENTAVNDNEEKENAVGEKLAVSVEKVKNKIKDSRLLDPEMLKDVFFGSQSDAYGEKAAEKGDADGEGYFGDEQEKDQPTLFDKSLKKRITVDPSKDKLFFSFDYMVNPEQALDGYMLFYNEFVKKKNIRLTLILGFIFLLSLFFVLMSPDRYFNYPVMLICLLVILIKWSGSNSAKKEAALSADDVKNDSYKLSFYNSRILIEASELSGDRIYNYPPVMIRFEDIDLKVIDYEGLYVLIFRKDYIYTVPKEAMSGQMNEVFKKHLQNILGDDYHEFYCKK